MASTQGVWGRALVTGASAGIGEAFARRLASDGAAVVLVARREPLLHALADELRTQHGGEVEVVSADLTDRRQRARVEDRLEDDARPIDLLVNNAGGGSTRARFVDHPRDHVEEVAVLNAIAVQRLTHAAAAAMVRRGGGHIVQVSAGVALYPVPGGAAYAASKAFVNSFSRAVGRELQGTGVSITTVCPGFTRTGAPKRIGFEEGAIPSFLWADPDDVVGSALSAAVRGRPLVFPRTVDRVAGLLLRHLPAGFMAGLGARIALPRADRAAR